MDESMLIFPRTFPNQVSIVSTTTSPSSFLSRRTAVELVVAVRLELAFILGTSFSLDGSFYTSSIGEYRDFGLVGRGLIYPIIETQL